MQYLKKKVRDEANISRKLAIPQYLMKDVTGELNFLYDDKHQSFKQADIIFFDKFCQACPKYPEKFCNILATNE